VAAMKDAGIQVILNYSISLNAEFVRTRETAPFLNNSFEIMRADGLLVDWSENVRFGVVKKISKFNNNFYKFLGPNFRQFHFGGYFKTGGFS